jgi:hypothetical protein
MAASISAWLVRAANLEAAASRIREERALWPLPQWFHSFVSGRPVHPRARRGRRAAGASSGRRVVERGVVDAVEDVGEGDHGYGQADLHQLRVGVAGRLDSPELVRADLAAGQDQRPNEADQGVALGVTRGLAGADLSQDVGLQTAKLGEQAVRGLAVMAADGCAD